MYRMAASVPKSSSNTAGYCPFLGALTLWTGDNLEYSSVLGLSLKRELKSNFLQENYEVRISSNIKNLEVYLSEYFNSSDCWVGFLLCPQVDKLGCVMTTAPKISGYWFTDAARVLEYAMLPEATVKWLELVYFFLTKKFTADFTLCIYPSDGSLVKWCLK